MCGRVDHLIGEMSAWLGSLLGESGLWMDNLHPAHYIHIGGVN